MSSQISKLIDLYDPIIKKLILNKLQNHECNKYFDINYKNLNCFPPETVRISKNKLTFGTGEHSEFNEVTMNFILDLSILFEKRITFENSLYDLIRGRHIDSLIYKYDKNIKQLYLEEVTCKKKIFNGMKGFNVTIYSYKWNDIKNIN
jgi:hypothetical protein